MDAAKAYTVIPYQLSDEAYANLLRNPEQCGFRVLQPGAVRDPQFGYLFLESRRHEARRPRLLDGLDWVPSSAANASSRVLHDGVTELVRNYCARRTKSEAARPQIRPFVEFQRSVNDEVKQQYPQASALDHKTIVGRMWRAMPSAEKEAYKAQAAAKNRNARQRMAAAQPQELLVRHEMWLQLSDLWTASDPPFDGACSERLLLHYLGDDAWHCLSCPPDAIGIVTDPWVPSTPSPWRSIGSGMRTTGPQAPQLVLSYSDQGEARPAPQVVHAIPLVAGQQAEPGAPTVPSFASLHQLGPSTSPALTVAASCEDADLAAHFGSGASFGGTGASFGGGAGGSAIDYGIAGASFGSPASFGGLAGLSAAGSFGTTALDQFLFQVQSGDPFHDDDGFSPLQSLATSVPLPNRPTGRFGAAHDEAEDLLLLTRLVQEEPIMRSLPPAKTARRAIGGRELPLSDSPNVMRAAALLAGVEPSPLTIPQVGASPMSVPPEAGPSRDQATSPIRMEETEPDADLPDFFTGAPADRRAAPAADAEPEQACRASEGGEDSAAAHPTSPTSGFTFEELYTAML